MIKLSNLQNKISKIPFLFALPFAYFLASSGFSISDTCNFVLALNSAQIIGASLCLTEFMSDEICF